MLFKRKMCSRYGIKRAGTQLKKSELELQRKQKNMMQEQMAQQSQFIYTLLEKFVNK